MTAPNPSVAQARTLLDELVRCGVEHIVVSPGSRSTALVMAAQADSGLRLHVRIDERSAGFLAVGIGRATGRPAAVVTTSGSAVANLFPAVVEADLGGVPLVLLTSDRPPELRETGANQVIVQPGIFGPATRWALDLAVAEDRQDANALWRSTAARAVAEATGARGGIPGPVHVNVPFREPTVPVADDGRAPAVTEFGSAVEGRRDGGPWTRHVRARPGPPADLVDLVVGLTGRPGVIGVADTRVDPRLLDAAASVLGWPVVAEVTADVGDARTVPHASITLDVVSKEARRPDALLLLGRPTASRALLDLAATVQDVVAVSPDGRWADPSRSATVAATCDPDALLAAIADGPSASGDSGDWHRTWDDAGVRVARAVDAALDAADELTEPLVARIVSRVAAPGHLVVGSSMPVRDLDDWGERRPEVHVVANRGASGIDGFASTATGVALGAGTPTVGLCGDLTFLHDRNGQLHRDDVDLVLVVVDNDGGGIFHFLPQAQHVEGFEEVFGTPHGLDLGRVVEASGLVPVLVRTAAGLASAVADAQRAGGRHVVIVRSDRSRNVAAHRELVSRVTAAVAGSAP